MIISNMQSTPPFETPHLIWRAVEFTHDPVSVLHWQDDSAAYRIDLPAQLRTAVAKRQAEYLAGRLCAASALHALGLPTDVPRAGRIPVWPNGCAGSISHTDHHAVAVVSARYQAVGVDRELRMNEPQAREIAKMIFNQSEAALRPQHLSFGQFTTLIFSAKEAFYKAVSQHVNRILDFHEVELLGLGATDLHLGYAGISQKVSWTMTPTDCTTLCAISNVEPFRAERGDLAS